MSLRVLVACLCLSSTANAQLKDRDSPKEFSQRLLGHSGPADADGPPYRFEIRMVSAPEETIRPLRHSTIPGPEQRKEYVPFEGWQTLDPDQSVVLQREQTGIKTSLDAAVVEITDRQIRQFITDSRQGEQRHIVFAPKVTVFEGQIGTITDQSKFQYMENRSLKSETTAPIEAVEGTQIFVRASLLDNGSTQADVDIHLHGLRDRDKIPVTEEGILTRVPQQTISTLACSGMLSGEELHIAILPHDDHPTESEKPSSRIELASRIVGLGKPKATELRQIVWLVSVRRVAD